MSDKWNTQTKIAPLYELHAKYGLNSFRYCAPKHWNSLSDIERTADNLNVFKPAIHKKTFQK
jgi:hypothetical protein